MILHNHTVCIWYQVVPSQINVVDICVVVKKTGPVAVAALYGIMDGKAGTLNCIVEIALWSPSLLKRMSVPVYVDDAFGIVMV